MNIVSQIVFLRMFVDMNLPVNILWREEGLTRHYRQYEFSFLNAPPHTQRQGKSHNTVIYIAP